MTTRKNEGYIITNAMDFGETEIVLGVHEKYSDRAVTWECRNGNDYYWGHYFMDLEAAQRDFCERCLAYLE